MNAFLWAILTAIVWGCVPMLEKIGLNRLETPVGLFYRCFGVLMGIVILLFFYGKEIKASLSGFHSGMIYLIAGGFIASVVGQLFFYNALKTDEASKIVPLAGSYPLVAFLLGALLLGEKVTLAKSAGMIFVVAGVYLLR